VVPHDLHGINFNMVDDLIACMRNFPFSRIQVCFIKWLPISVNLGSCFTVLSHKLLPDTYYQGAWLHL
jgi:hypothetical protein